MATVLSLPTPEAVPGSEVSWNEVQWLPCRVSAELSLEGFTLGDVLRLQVGSVINTHRASRMDVSLCVNGELIGWGEFDASGERLAVRMREIA